MLLVHDDDEGGPLRCQPTMALTYLDETASHTYHKRMDFPLLGCSAQMTSLIRIHLPVDQVIPTSYAGILYFLAQNRFGWK